MNKRRCLKIADRLDVALLRELNQGIDRQRMVDDARYARDVLLVCDACPGTDLVTLAKVFRQASAEPDAAAAPASGAAKLLNTVFGAFDTESSSLGGSRLSGWFSRGDDDSRAPETPPGTTAVGAATAQDTKPRTRSRHSRS